MDNNDRVSNDRLLGEIHSKVQEIPYIRKDISDLNIKVAKLETLNTFQSKLWGALAGFISAGTLILISSWKKIIN